MFMRTLTAYPNQKFKLRSKFLVFYVLNYQEFQMSKQSHPHLLAQELQVGLRQAKLNLKEIILQQNIDYYNLDRASLRAVLEKIKCEVVKQSSYKFFQEQAHDRMNQQVDTLFTSDSRKHSYLVDVFKQASAFPLMREREEGVFNLEPLYRRIISKQLRRVIWSREFNRQNLRKKYLLVDREVTPYKVDEELKMAISKLAATNEMTLKDNQKDAALRIMQYFVKISNKIPHRYHNYVALNVVDLFSFHSPSKSLDLGAIALGLVGLADSYKEIDVEVRFARIMRAITIVDSQSAAHIQQFYLQDGNGKRELNECFQYFRLTLGASHLPIPASQFLIDQLIIRKFCSFDMYVFFAITVLIISDEFDKQEKNKPKLKDIIDRAKTIVKLQDFVEAYCTIYQAIPAFHSADDLESHPNSQLLLEMIACDSAKPGEDDSNFVLELDEQPRIGSKF